MGADDNIRTVIAKLNFIQSDRFVQYERRETGMTTIKYTTAIKYTTSFKIFICVCILAQIANKLKMYKITIVNMRSSPEFYVFTSLFFPPPPHPFTSSLFRQNCVRQSRSRAERMQTDGLDSFCCQLVGWPATSCRDGAAEMSCQL